MKFVLVLFCAAVSFSGKASLAGQSFNCQGDREVYRIELDSSLSNSKKFAKVSTPYSANLYEQIEIDGTRLLLNNPYLFSAADQKMTLVYSNKSIRLERFVFASCLHGFTLCQGGLIYRNIDCNPLD